MATISEALALAIQHHQTGRLQAAEQIYRQILQADPNHADAIHLLGVIAHQVGKLDEAIACCRRALELKPDSAEVHNNLGVIFREQGKLDEAVACYRRALELRPDYAKAHNNLGVALKEQGKLDEAVACWRRALEPKPDYAEAHSNLGNACRNQGKLDEAIACYRRALELRPDFAEVHINLGNTWNDQGKLDEAIACYRRALELRPDFAEAHSNLGNTYRNQRKLEEAVACYRRALELKPDFADVLINLGNTWNDQGKLEEAVACYRRALELKPDFAEGHSNLGNTYRNQGKLEEAVACYRRALELKPDFAEVHIHLGDTWNDQGKLEETVACYRRALELKPDFAEIHVNLGNAYRNQGKLDEAVACCRRALDLKPDFAEAHYNLGVTFQDQGKLEEAVTCYHRALELKPDLAATYNNLGNVFRDQGKLEEAVACYRRALELKPDLAEAHSNLLLALQYCAGVTPGALAEAHAEYDRQHAAPLGGAIAQQQKVSDRQNRLRLGFVSGDLGRHPVGCFLVRVLENLSQERYGMICYSDRIVKDDLTCRFQAAATQWRDVLGMNDQQLAEQVRADQIDILFDLAGHTAHNRLLTFARKPAAIQITWLGYVGTTGLKAMDYILADRYEIPPELETYYCEKVLRMPDGYVCFEPPDDAPPVGPLPVLDRTQVTLGCFNNTAKITSQVIEVWARILRRLPGSRLVLKYKGWNDRSVAGRFAEMFAIHAIDPGRLEFFGCSSHAELLTEYQRIDLALDPFPYSGGLTTCEALWMGVPVVTCPGETFASRHSLSHLSNVGLTETIAHDLDEYVELAVSLAGDLPRLAALRAGLRQRMAVSPLCDGKRFAANLMSLLQDVWEQRISAG
jgi:predicted O-linked N-acetylglucosamine transferase (SPINDLY family)